MKTILPLLVMVIFLSSTYSQEMSIDTVQVDKILSLESTIDSLRLLIRKMDKEIQQVKQDVADGSEFDKFLAILNDEEVDETPEDQRSRRKRVDALLKAVSQRPGQLRFNGGATSVVQSNFAQEDQFTTGVGSFNIFAHTSFGNNTLLFIDFESIGGNGPDPHLTNLSGLNADAGSTQDSDGIDRLNVLEAWTEFTALSEAFTITAGKIDLTNYFDNNAAANDETSQFLSASFVNNSAIPAPPNSPGLRIRTTLLNRYYLQFGISSYDNSGDELFKSLFKIGSIGFKVFSNTDWEGNLRLYTYAHPMADNSMGYGLSFDQSIASAFIFFARAGSNSSELGDWFGVSSSWSTGARFMSSIARKRTIVGLAFGVNKPSQSSMTKERIFEFYARQQMNRWVYVSPHLQVIQTPFNHSKYIAIAGLRTQFNF